MLVINVLTYDLVVALEYISVLGRCVITLTGWVQHPGFTDEHVALQAHLVK